MTTIIHVAFTFGHDSVGYLTNENGEVIYFLAEKPIVGEMVMYRSGRGSWERAIVEEEGANSMKHWFTIVSVEERTYTTTLCGTPTTLTAPVKAGRIYYHLAKNI